MLQLAKVNRDTQLYLFLYWDIELIIYAAVIRNKYIECCRGSGRDRAAPVRKNEIETGKRTTGRGTNLKRINTDPTKILTAATASGRTTSGQAGTDPGAWDTAAGHMKNRNIKKFLKNYLRSETMNFLFYRTNRPHTPHNPIENGETNNGKGARQNIFSRACVGVFANNRPIKREIYI